MTYLINFKSVITTTMLSSNLYSALRAILYYYLIILSIYPYSIISTDPNTSNNNNNNKLFNLVLVTYFKNEALNIREFIRHYINEGVEHFYMIDNGSTDNYLEIINHNTPRGLITIVRDDHNHTLPEGLQNNLLRKYFTSLLINEANWVIIVDLDEFIYSTDMTSTISDTLNKFDYNVKRIFLLWKLFGGNNVIKHPVNDLLVKTFNARAEFHIAPSVINLGAGLYGHGKMIVRVSNKLLLETHASLTDDNHVYLPIYNSQPIFSYEINNNGHRQISENTSDLFREEFLHHHVLQLNHYSYQSREYYEKYKTIRGGGQSGHTSKYTIEFYDKHANSKHNNLIFDDELYRKNTAMKHKPLV